MAQNNKEYTIVSFHSPIYCAGYFGPTDDRKETSELFKGLRATFDKYNVTAHFAGHTHIYERSWPIRDGKRRDSGITYFVQGGDINGNFPEWWTAVADDRTRYAQPTYTMVWCKDDRFETRFSGRR
ncbi:MAG: metallophosphoesterase [Candidatus Hydrogenedentes bacterium]|nr:metallophosphoesterase [Candidatus Hydrogenedentota bacterium]